MSTARGTASGGSSYSDGTLTDDDRYSSSSTERALSRVEDAAELLRPSVGSVDDYFFERAAVSDPVEGSQAAMNTLRQSRDAAGASNDTRSGYALSSDERSQPAADSSEISSAGGSHASMDDPQCAVTDDGVAAAAGAQAAVEDSV